MKRPTNLTVIMLLAGCLASAANGPAQDPGAALKLRVLDGRPVVDCVLVNGRGPYRFLVDTGAQMNMLDPRIARSAGLESTFQTEMVSAAGSVRASGSDLLEITVGGAKAEAQRTLFSGMQEIQRFAPEIQGVLGQEFLSHFDYLLDLRGKRLTFGKIDRPGTRVALLTTHGLPAVPGGMGPLLLDSGAGQVVLFGVAAGNRVRKTGTVSGAGFVGTIAGQGLAIGGRDIRYDEALTVPQKTENVNAIGLLPVRLFKALYVCNSEGYVVLD